jgi:putative ABC transport system ATP-binding protein/lipoprotein-releasing system ATP-binding protein
MESLYRLENIQYSYDWNQQKVPVLRGIDLQLPTASFSCLVGPSGVGKTTLLNLMGLIESPSQGRLFFCGQDAATLKEKEKERWRLEKIGFVFQAFYLIPTLTVLENASYFLPLLGMNHDKARAKAMEVLDLLGLADHSDKKPLQLSGGQRQRVAIARAIAKRPQVVLADEPTANLDSETATKIIKAFQELQKAEKTSFIFSTHDAHLVSYSKSVFKMNDGRIFESLEQAGRS